MEDLDVERLRGELHDLSQQRFQVSERLRQLDATRGRGRGMGPGPGPGWAPGPGRGSVQLRLSDPAAARDHSFQNQQGYRDQRVDGPDFSRQAIRGRDNVEEVPVAPPQPAKRLMSAIVVNGQARMPRQQADGEPLPMDKFVATKRPPPSNAEQNPAAQKRARRLFGSLMGTLAKASAQEEQFKQAGLAQKRQEAMQRVREREREERARARQEARNREIAERQAEINKKRELNAMTEIKRLEIMTAERLKHRTATCNTLEEQQRYEERLAMLLQMLATFIRTKAGPPLHWLPAHHTPATQELLQQQQELLEDWKAEELERLAAERQTILAARAPHLAKQSAAANGDADDVEEADGEAEGERSDHEEDKAEEAQDDGGDGERWQTDAADNDDRWGGNGGGDGNGTAHSEADEQPPDAEAASPSREDNAETLDDLLK